MCTDWLIRCCICTTSFENSSYKASTSNWKPLIIVNVQDSLSLVNFPLKLNNSCNFTRVLSKWNQNCKSWCCIRIAGKQNEINNFTFNTIKLYITILEKSIKIQSLLHFEVLEMFHEPTILYYKTVGGQRFDGTTTTLLLTLPVDDDSG